MRKAADEALIGRTIAGKFLVDSFVGSGAMGAVYKARQIALDKTVALKVMHPDLAGDASFASRFQREAKAASRLDHPNSVRVLDFGAEPDGLLYIAMEFLAGKDLLALMREAWPMPGARIVDLVMQVLSALSVAHGLGIVHRDLKPENIMVLPSADEDGHPIDVVKVCDFGIAKITNDPRAQTAGGAKGPLTSSGTLIGTPEYMSPEQGRGDTLDARSDLYSVGVILYQLLTGRVPFEAESAIGVILKHITDDPKRPSLLNAHVDPRLEAICLKAMRKPKEERYQTAREMRADLRAVRDQALGLSAQASARGAFVSAPELGVAATIAAASGGAAPSGGAAASGGTAPSGSLAVPTMQERPPAFRSAPSAGTPAGTEIAIAAPRATRRGPAVAVALVALLAGAGVGVALFARTRAAKPVAAIAAAPSETSGDAPVAVLSPLLPSPDPSSSAVSAPRAPSAPHASGAIASPVAATTGARGVAAAPSARAVASTAPAPVASVVPAVTTPPAPAAPPPAAPAPAPPAAPEAPPIDPDKAWVEVGLVTPNNVKGDAVRAAIRQAPLTQCYRNALRARATKATGVATLNLSIDETGRVSGAILTGADWLPEVRRCAQGAAMGVQLRPGSVESGGGTAEVWLSFRMP